MKGKDPQNILPGVGPDVPFSQICNLSSSFSGCAMCGYVRLRVLYQHELKLTPLEY